jgi:hypothetical protein
MIVIMIYGEEGDSWLIKVIVVGDVRVNGG